MTLVFENEQSSTILTVIDDNKTIEGRDKVTRMGLTFYSAEVCSRWECENLLVEKGESFGKTFRLAPTLAVTLR